MKRVIAGLLGAGALMIGTQAHAVVIELVFARLGHADQAPAMRESVECRGWSVFNLSAAAFDMANPARNDWLRSSGATSAAIAGWPGWRIIEGHPTFVAHLSAHCSTYTVS